MRTHISHADPSALAASRPDGRWFASTLQWIMNRFLLLPLGVAIALVWANTSAEDYFRFSHAWAFFVNEIAMAVFLALVAQDLYESLMRGGEFSHWHNWTLSVVAAVGGLAGSVGAFMWFVDVNGEQVLATAWPVVAAVDLAAGYYVMRTVYPRRSSVAAFVVLAAVITDVITMTVVTTQSPEFRVHIGGVVLLLAAILSALWLRRAGVRNFGPYWFGCGTAAWFAMYWMGIHPALALVPIIPLMPHEPRRHDTFADPADDDEVHHAEHAWNAAAQIALFMFGLVNGGVLWRHVDTGTWGVLLAAIVGRPAGLLIAVGLTLSVGVRLPRGMRWPDLLVAALATTTGFTFSLFLTAVTLPIGAVAEQITLGALGTVAGAAVTIGMARLLAVGRFTRGAGH